MEGQKFHGRLEKIQEKFNLSKKEMANIMGIQPRSFYTAKTKGMLLSMSAILNLQSEFPELNIDWLLLGRGEMLTPSTEPQVLRERNEVYHKPANDLELESRLDNIDEMLEKIYKKLL